MPDHTLHGNHNPCSACAIRREQVDLGPINREAVPCNMCDGDGFLKLSATEIVRLTVEEARRDYWPKVEARWRLEA